MPSTWRCYALTFPEWTFLSDLTTGSSRSYCHCIQRSRLNNVHDYEFNSAIVMVPCTRRKASMQFADACVCWVVNFKPRGAISVRVLTACYEPRRASLRNRTFSSAKAFHILPIANQPVGPLNPHMTQTHCFKGKYTFEYGELPLCRDYCGQFRFYTLTSYTENRPHTNESIIIAKCRGIYCGFSWQVLHVSPSRQRLQNLLSANINCCQNHIYAKPRQCTRCTGHVHNQLAALACNVSFANVCIVAFLYYLLQRSRWLHSRAF